MTEHWKHPKTMHLLFSEGLQNDDRKIQDEFCFKNKYVAITEKRDGEGSNLYNNGFHVRSLSSVHHPSRSFVKSLHSSIKNEIPEGWKIYGENLYGVKSIPYNDLKSYFEVIMIWDENRNCLSLDNTLIWCKKLNLTHVPILDIIKIEENNFNEVKKWSDIIISEGKEGIVIRNIEQFHYSDFQNNVAKTVRKGHVQPNESHWLSHPVIPNKLKEK